MLTDAGLRWIWQMCLGDLRDAQGALTDQLKSARIVVGNGTTPFSGSDTRLAGELTEQVALDSGYPQLLGMVDDGDNDGEPDACRLVFQGTFGEDKAVFDWQERGIVTAQGVLLDRAVTDQGRKVLGSVWEVEAALQLDR